MYHHYSPEIVSRFLKRLEGTQGNVNEAAKSLNIPTMSIRNWRRRDKEFDERCRAVLKKTKARA